MRSQCTSPSGGRPAPRCQAPPRPAPRAPGARTCSGCDSDRSRSMPVTTGNAAASSGVGALEDHAVGVGQVERVERDHAGRLALDTSTTTRRRQLAPRVRLLHPRLLSTARAQFLGQVDREQVGAHRQPGARLQGGRITCCTVEKRRSRSAKCWRVRDEAIRRRRRQGRDHTNMTEHRPHGQRRRHQPTAAAWRPRLAGPRSDAPVATARARRRRGVVLGGGPWAACLTLVSSPH